MLETVQNLFFANPLELYTAVIATLGVAFWLIDRRSMKAALNAARASETNALRFRRQEIEAGVERNFATLQMKCQATRDIWRNHNLRNGPKLGLGLHFSSEQKEILRVERAGGSFLDHFKSSAPKPDSSEIDELEAYFAAADHTSLQLKRLESQLPEPQNFYH
ncbi:hypothetical protein ROLI_013140 [Roseobacter fucihabitans]|uniref:DUF4446 family protein n=1 Tax=Roseobacter fucihabitans TaxID=1537242 RepID=A0ABZ2BSQ7_9RHOB|nr:hypothetical protein [Roseobacter litoralis]MBC6968121.1 hypothetical protein [Roseobacter litoralis]